MKTILTCLACVLASALLSQSSLQPTPTAEAASRVVQLDVPKLAQQLAKAPDLSEKTALQPAVPIVLPMPDGSTKTFHLFKTQPMHPDLAAQFPEIQTWHGKGDDGVSAVAITISPAGLTVMIVDEHFQRSFIEPEQKLGGNFKLPPNLGYVAYYDTKPMFQCQHTKASAPSSLTPHPSKKC